MFQNDLFYTQHLTRVFRRSQLDTKLRLLGTATELGRSNLSQVLGAHGYLVRLFAQLTNKEKGSLASKYLHFHRPRLFFIYDLRAMSSIRMLAVRGQEIDPPANADPQYAAFVARALGVREHVLAEFGVLLTPRQLDRLLLAAFPLVGLLSGDAPASAGAETKSDMSRQSAASVHSRLELASICSDDLEKEWDKRAGNV